jgi:hypothetical protein
VHVVQWFMGAWGGMLWLGVHGMQILRKGHFLRLSFTANSHLRDR